MRITNNTMVSNYMLNVQGNLQKVDKLNTQINSQQQVNKVSEDPYKAIKIMNLKNDISDVDKYNSNCDEMLGWMDTMDESLESVGTLASEMKVLLTSISGGKDISEIVSIGKDINGKLEEIGNALNAKFLGNNVFSGSAVGEKPIIIDKDANGKVTLSINPAINDDSLNIELSNNVTYNYNNSLESVIGADGLDIINSINDLFDNPESLTMDDVTKAVEDLGGFVDKTLASRTTVGIKTNTVEAIKTANDTNLEKLKGTYSSLQDIDVVEKYVELSAANLVYQSTLQVGSKIIQPTLLDYLR